MSLMTYGAEYRKIKRGALVPDHSKIQYAGSMGLISASVGWQYLNGKMETDYYFGYLPRSMGFSNSLTTSLEQTYIPWEINNDDGSFFNPLITGIYINRVFGNNYYTDLPSKYPDDYYWWMSAVRINFFIGSRLIFENEGERVPDVGIYTRINTNDLYLVSAIENDSIKLFDIIKISLGCYLRF